MPVLFEIEKYLQYGAGLVNLASAYFGYGKSTAVTRSTKTAYTVTYTDQSGNIKTKQVAFVDQAPAQLAQDAGVDLETYSLARCLASEGYGTSADPDNTDRGKPVAIVAIAQAVRNKAKAKWNGSITKTLTYSTWAAKDPALPQWHYGEQSGRYASTSADPNRWHIEVAKAVLNDTVPNIVGDAYMFFDPKTQDGGVQAGKRIQPADVTLTDWHSRNAWIGPIAGLDSYYLMFLRPESDAKVRAQALSAALQVVYDGRQGSHAPAEGTVTLSAPRSDVGRVIAVTLVSMAVAGAIALLIIKQTKNVAYS